MKPVLRVVNSDGSLGGVLPHYANLQAAWDDGDVSTIQFDYPSDKPGASLLADQTRVALYIGGTKLPETFLLDDANADQIKDANPDTWAGTGGLQQLDWAIVYPATFPTIDTTTGQAGDGYSTDTPGKALRYLIELAQGRGTLASMTWDFTDTVDSAGVAWPTTVTDFWQMGTTLLDVVRAWYTKRLAVARWNGVTGKLQLFAYGNQGVDRTGTVVLQRGLDVLDGANDKSTRATRSVMLVASDTVAVERTSAPGLSAYQRREGFVSQTGVTDTTVLDSIGDTQLSLTARQLQAYTFGLSTKRWTPMLDYGPGDKLTIRSKAGVLAMGVRQLALTWDSAGTCTATGQFGDRILDMEDTLQATLDLLTGGALASGSGSPVVAGTTTDTSGSTGGGTTTDTLAPAPITGLAGTSTVVFNQQSEYATLSLSWTAPTTNSDGTALSDLGGYDVQYQPPGSSGWIPIGSVGKDTPNASIPGLYPGTTYTVRVRAKDIWDNVSTWVSSAFTTTTDTTAPTQTPSTPTVVTFLYNGLQVTWDGKSSTAGAMDNDTRYVEVHVSTTTGFTPTTATRVDYLPAGGGVTVVGQLTAGTTYYVKFRVVDWAGNIGPSSAQATGVPVQVGNSNLASGSVGTAQLQSLAVTDAQISTLSATKITAGTLSAVVTLSGTFQTAASGARVVVNSAGINLYNAAGNATVTMNSADGTANFTGNLVTCNVSGSVKAYSTTSGAFIVLSASLYGVPAMNMSTGKVIEKYPAWIFTTTNNALKYLITYVNAPGSQLAGSATGTGYFYTNMQMISEVIDGDYANATTLPTTMSGRVVFDFPSGAYYPGSQIMGQSSVTLRAHYASWSNDYSVLPAVVLRDSADTNGANYHEAALRLSNSGSPTAAQGSGQCEIMVVSGDGGAEANLAAWIGTFITVNSQAFNNTSSATVKEEIHDVPYSAVELVHAHPAKRWKYVDRAEEDDFFHIGPMADDAHEDIARPIGAERKPGLSLNSMVGVLWKAVEELSEQLKELQHGSTDPAHRR